MKAVLSNRIILNVSKELQERIISELTYRIPQKYAKLNTGPEIIKTFSRIKDGIFSIPSGRMDLIPADYEIVDKRILVPVEFPKFKFPLRESQQVVFDDIEDSAIVNAPVSWGKTFAAIAIASKLSQKTLVVTHTTMLRDQWVKEVEKTLGIQAGVIGSGKFNIDSPIVIGNVQTLTKCIPQISDIFGTIIVDECHHTPATTFSNIIDKCKARYKIGLSGTLERKDGKHVVFNDYFGFNVYKPDPENCLTPEVLIVNTDIIMPSGSTWADKVTNLENHTIPYKKLVVELADSAVNVGHKVLVVGSRVDFLEKCARESQNPAAAITGAIKSMQDRQDILDSVATGAKHIIYGTCSIFAEGISQNDLSCIILATPINNDPMLTQLIGRIVRLKEGKKQPLIIDINLKGAQTANQARHRYSHYLRKGYKIRVLDK